MKEQLEQILLWSASQIKNDPNKFQAVEAVMNQLIGDASCLTCPGGIQSALDYMQAYYSKSLNKSNFMKTNCNFEIKRDGTLYVPSRHVSYNNATLTDEIALELILSNPNQKANFSKLPANLDELLAAAAKKKGNGKKTGEKGVAPVIAIAAAASKENETEEPGDNEGLIEELDKLTKAQLKEKCAAANLPEADYSKLNKIDLIAYVIKNVK
jgi:hypothetical protein